MRGFPALPAALRTSAGDVRHPGPAMKPSCSLSMPYLALYLVACGSDGPAPDHDRGVDTGLSTGVGDTGESDGEDPDTDRDVTAPEVGVDGLDTDQDPDPTDIGNDGTDADTAVGPRATCDPDYFACCDDDGLVSPAGTECLLDRFQAELPEAGEFPLVEYRCVAGSGIEARRGVPGCTGVAATCSLAPEHVVWKTDWVLEYECACVDTDYGPVCSGPAPDGDLYCEENRPFTGRCHEDSERSLFDIAFSAGKIAACFGDEGMFATLSFCDPYRRCQFGVPIGTRGARPLSYAGAYNDCADQSDCQTYLGGDWKFQLWGAIAECGTILRYRAPCESGDVCCDESVGRQLGGGAACGDEIYDGRSEFRCIDNAVVRLDRSMNRCFMDDYRAPRCERKMLDDPHDWYWNINRIRCASNAECPTGYLCDGDRCELEMPACDAESDCLGAFDCVDARCIPQPCRSIDEDCGDGYCHTGARDGHMGDFVRDNYEWNACAYRLWGEEGTYVEELPGGGTLTELGFDTYLSGSQRLGEVIDDCGARGAYCSTEGEVPQCVACSEGECCNVESQTLVAEGTTCGEPRTAVTCASEFIQRTVEYEYSCRGDSPYCRGVSTFFELAECEEGERCYDAEDGSGPRCQPTFWRCHPDDPGTGRECCRGWGLPRPGAQCGSPSDETILCGGTPSSNQARMQRTYGTCQDDGSCSTEPGETAVEEILIWCGWYSHCETLEDGTSQCSEPMIPPCDSGACCNLDTSGPQPYGTPCDGSIPLTTETRCEADGSAVLERVFGPACDGVYSACSGERAYSQWEVADVCQSNEACVEADEGHVCEVGQRPCDDGACCVDERMATRTTACDAPDAEFYEGRICYATDLYARYGTYLCSGASADCPYHPGRAFFTRNLISYCSAGCGSYGGQAACHPQSDPGGGGGGSLGCGDSCVFDGQCPSGSVCVGDTYCGPPQCEACGAGEVCYRYSDCTYAYGCGDGASSGGGSSPGGGGGPSASGDCIGGSTGSISRGGFVANGVPVNGMEVDYSFGGVDASTLINLRYKYVSTDGSTKLPYNTYIYVVTEDGGGNLWYTRHDPAVPESGEWSYNVSSYRSSGRLFCSSFGTDASCMSIEQARNHREDGPCVVGFQVVNY